MNDLPENRVRDLHGKWRKGISGNPGGRPAAYAVFVEAAHRETPDALRQLVWLRDHADNHAVRLAACREILDRGFGRPAQAVQLTGEDNGPLRTEIIVRRICAPVDEGAA